MYNIQRVNTIDGSQDAFLAGRKEYVPDIQMRAIHWYVIHTQDQSAAKHIFDNNADIRETFYPVRHIAAGTTGRRRAESILPHYVFVRGDFKTVKDIAKSCSLCEISYVRKNNARCPMIVPDDEMDVFKTFNEYHLDMMWLRNPYPDFMKNDRARILSGPFASYEGFIKEINHDMKLVFRVGIWAIAVSNLHKYDVAIVSHGEDISEAGRIARLVDYFALSIREAGLTGNSYAILRAIIAGIGKLRSVEKYAKSLMKEHSGKDNLANLALRSFIREMSGDDKGMLEQMAGYIYSKETMPVLSRIIPDMPLRPFLTSTQGSDGIPVDIAEGTYDANTDKSTSTVNRYYAHVLTLNNAGGGFTLVTNWTCFYSQYLDMSPDMKGRFLERLVKFNLPCFHRCLLQESPIHFMEFPEQGIAGLGMIVPQSSGFGEVERNTETMGVDLGKVVPQSFGEVEQNTGNMGDGLGMAVPQSSGLTTAQTELIKAGVALCNEISASTRLRPWQRHLSTVWLR